MQDTLTPWYPPHIKPVRVGWYEVGHDPATQPHFNSRHRLTGSRRYFDGTVWRAGWLNEQVSIMGKHPSHRWRGLAHPPQSHNNSASCEKK